MQAEMAGVISISSHVAYGAVGNRIIVPVLEALGISVTAIHTVNLPWHPGMNTRFGHGARVVPDDAAFAAIISNLAKAPWLGEIDAIITGYLGSPAQAEAIAKLVKLLKRANPNALYLCDPVIGDTGGLYVPEATAIAIRDHLWPLADIVTPNLFEFGWMTGEAATQAGAIITAARALHKRHVVVTSTDAGHNKIGNLLVSNSHSALASHNAIFPTPNGTGDMLAALFLGHIVQENTAVDALEKAASSVLWAINHANEHHKSSLSPEHLRTVMNMNEAVAMSLID
jgi:pyridoxine kinase